MTLKDDLRKIFDQIVPHTVAMLLAVISIWCVEVILEYLKGNEAKFFDLVPIHYVTQLGGLVVILKFIWHVISDFRE